jgi:putative hydrolase of the HAD superfamily
MYQHIFFDLDHTLWDFKANATETLLELAEHHKLKEKGIDSVHSFIEDYITINDILWEDYRKGFILKDHLRLERFRQALEKYDITDADLCDKLSNDYVKLCPLKTNLFPNAISTLNYLKEKYELHIITNGFEEVQHIKLRECKLTDYFSEIITSERAGYKKPDERIFQYAISTTKALKSTSIMIGDSLEADIIGARDAGIDQVYFNPDEHTHEEDITHEIKNLHELTELL